MINYRALVAELNQRIPAGFVEPAWRKNMPALEDFLLDDYTFSTDYLPFLGYYYLFSPEYVDYRLRRLRRQIADYPEATKTALLHDLPYRGIGEWRTKYGSQFAPGVPDICSDVAPVTMLHASAIVDVMTNIGLAPTDLRSAVIWGGGYGSQMDILKIISPSITEYAIDLPICSMIQYDHCASAFGEDQVALISSEDTPFEEGKINIVPLPFISRIPDGHTLLIATHSLNECPIAAQNYVAHERNWFETRYLIISYAHNSDFGDDVFENFDRIYNNLSSTCRFFSHDSHCIFDREAS